jgi:hypothetical protein
MYFKSIVASVFFFVFLSSFVEKKTVTTFAKAKKLVGVYDRDSLLNEVPRLRNMKAEVDAEKRQMDSIHVALYDNLAQFRSNFYRDSAKMSPVIKELKFREIQDMRVNIAQFAQYSNEQIKSRYERLNHDFNNIFILTAVRIQKNQGLDTVLDKKQIVAYKKQHSPVKTKNVTSDMRADLEEVK